jgi:hypothetical protein
MAASDANRSRLGVDTRVEPNVANLSAQTVSREINTVFKPSPTLVCCDRYRILPDGTVFHYTIRANANTQPTKGDRYITFTSEERVVCLFRLVVPIPSVPSASKSPTSFGQRHNQHPNPMGTGPAGSSTGLVTA